MSAGTSRTLTISLLILALAYMASSLTSLHRAGTYGFVAGDNGIVTSVTANGPAAAAGIDVGDRVLHSRTSAAFWRAYSSGFAISGNTFVLATERNGKIALQRIRIAPIAIDPFSVAKRPIAAIICVLAAVLLFLRPQRATWAFFAYAALTGISSGYQYWSQTSVAVSFGAGDAVQPLIGLALLHATILFLHERPRVWQRIAAALATAGSFGLAVALAIGGNSGSVSLWNQIWIALLTLLTLAILLEMYLSGRRVHRQRIAWVAGGIAFAALFQIFVPIFVSETAAAVRVSVMSAVCYALYVVSPLVVCAAVLYAMLQYRVVDVRFVVNRALVYAATTSALVALFALLEWAASKLFEGSRVEAYAGIAAALLVGFAVNAFHKRTDALIDLLFFRREHKAAERLKHLAASLQFVDDERTVNAFLIEEPVRLLDLSSAAVFCATAGGTFTLAGSLGWDGHTAAAISRTDPIVPQLRAADSPLWLHEIEWRLTDMPAGAAEPLIALPIKARADLFGIVLYGGHTNGATLNAEERDLLAGLVSNAASAYDHIEASRVREEMQRLTLQVEAFRQVPAS